MTLKRFCQTASLVLGVSLSVTAFGSGFGLYEPSVISHAMGGALVGKAMDASANFNNPATLTDLTNIWVTTGFVTEHPRGSVKVNGMSHDMDPGAFILPHFQAAIPLPFDFVFGLGISPEYGLGTEYSKGWSMNWNTVETTVESIVINPNLAYKVTDEWSVGVGLRWLYFDFEQTSYPAGHTGTPFEGRPLKLEGDNGWKDVGWQIGTKYDILDNLAVGFVYKAAIDTTIKGDSRTDLPPALVGNINGDAEADLTLPQSVTGGINWDATDRWHFGTALSWTQWSEIDTLHFVLNGQDNPKSLRWHDTWRSSWGAAYDFLDDWTAMLSYVYDMDCTSRHQSSAMLPPADRHILGAGLRWRCWRGLELALSYSCIFMDGGKMETNRPGGGHYTLKTEEGFCHAAGFSVAYRF